ncbi:MAG: methyltransferase domain-containing protein [bacterium]
MKEPFELPDDEQPEAPRYDYYDFYRHSTEHPLPRMAEYFRQNYEYLASLVGPESITMDVGSGSGHVTKYLAPLVRRAIAIDHDPRMISLATENLKDNKNVDIVSGEFLDIDLPKTADVTFASFNIVGSLDIAPEDRVAFLKKMIECTKPGGHVVADFWSDVGIEFAKEFYIQSGSEKVEIQETDVLAADANGVVRHIPRWTKDEITELAKQVSANFKIVDLGGIFYALDITVGREDKTPSPYVGRGPLGLEEELLAGVSDDRRSEIKKHGRAEVYREVAHYLKGDVRIAFALVNYVPAIVDDDIDKSGNLGSLLDARAILNESFLGKRFSSLEPWEQKISDLGTVLSKLDRDGFDGAKKVVREVINYWIIEQRNLERQDKVLAAEELDELSLNIGKSVGLQFLYLLTPELSAKDRERIASLYGLAIKLADNISDLGEDLRQGYINISREDIEKYNLDASDLNEKGLRCYVQAELERTKHHYEMSDVYLEEAIEKYPECREALIMFKKIAHSWLKQASEISYK